MTLLLWAPTWAQSGDGVIGLEEAKKYAISNNYEILNLRKTYEEVQSRSRRARSAFFPTLGVAGGANNYTSTLLTQSAPIGYAYANYNLFNGLSDVYKKEMADIELDKAGVRLNRAEFRVGLEVEESFHLYLFKKSAIQLKQSALKLNDETKSAAKQRRSAGMASDSDVMEFDLREAILRSDILQLEQELEDSRSRLKRLLGEEIGSKIEPLGKLQHQHLKGTLAEYLSRIKDFSEKIQLASRSVSSSMVESKLWRARWLPRIDLDAFAGYLPLGTSINVKGEAGAGFALTAKFDLFNGFDGLYQKRELEAKRSATEAELKGSILATVTQTEIAYRQIKTVEARVDLEEENEKRAHKYYHSILSEYKRGIKNSADVRMAAEIYFEAQLRRESYKYEFLNQRIQLEKSLGSRVEVEVIHEG